MSGLVPAGRAGAWRTFGELDLAGVVFAVGGLVPPGQPYLLLDRIAVRLARTSWRGHQRLYGRPHPGQQHARNLYRQRARRRTGRR